MVEEKELNGYWKAVNESNRQLSKEAVDKKLHSLDRAGTWNIVDKVERGMEVGSKWVFMVKRLADGSIDKFKGRLLAQSFTQCPDFDFDGTYTPLFVLISCSSYLPLCWYKVSVHRTWMYKALSSMMNSNKRYIWAYPKAIGRRVRLHHSESIYSALINLANSGTSDWRCTSSVTDLLYLTLIPVF
jgi:hypothetical protein